MTSAAVTDTASLGYTYDQKAVAKTTRSAAAAWPKPWPQRAVADSAAGTDKTVPGIKQLVGATSKPIELVGQPVTVAVPIDSRSLQDIAADQTVTHHHQVYLDIDDVEADRDPGTVYGLYIALPSNPSDADLDDHHVGNLSLFGVERSRDPKGDEHAHSRHTSIEITETLDRLATRGGWQDGANIEVTLMPLSLQQPPGEKAVRLAALDHPRTPVTVGRIAVRFS